MRPGGVAQRHHHRLRGEARLSRGLDLAVIAPRAQRERRMRGVRRRAVIKLAAEVDEFHGWGPLGGDAEIDAGFCAVAHSRREEGSMSTVDDLTPPYRAPAASAG